MAELVVSAAQDASIDAADTDNHRGTISDLFVKGSAPRRVLINFDVSALPVGASITSATLRLFREGSFGSNPAGRTYLVNRLTRAWVEAADANPASDGATWSHADIPAVAWTSPGGDFVTTDQASATVPANGEWAEWDVTALVANRPDDTIMWIVRDSLTSGNAQTVFTARNGTPNTPQLVINYEEADTSSEGTASGAISWVGSASGTSVHSGTASGAIGWAGTATGDTPANTGSASGAISWVGSVDGETEHEGTADGAVSWVGSADGATDYSGSASGAITWDGSADGETEHEGTADGAIAWVGTVEGTADHEGTADEAVSWEGTATGVSPAVGVQDGQAIGAISWDGTATGETNPEGTADGSITWTGTANGVNDPQGAANGTIGWAGTVNGDAPSLVPEGEADRAVGWNGTVNGVSGQTPRLVSMSWPARHAAANTCHPLHLNN